MLKIVLSPRVGLLLGSAILTMTQGQAWAQAPLLPTPLADVSIYPNPAHIRATVAVPAVANAIRAIVTLSDAQGTVVLEQPMSLTEEGGKAELPLLGRAPGMYRVTVRAADQHVTKTLKVE